MKKLTFGTPEDIVPSKYCDGFNYVEKNVSYPKDSISFRTDSYGCVLELPIRENEHFFGLGLQLKTLELSARKYMLRVNSDPIAATGDSHAPVPFFVSTLGYGIYFDTARCAEFEFGHKRALTLTDDKEKNSIATSTDELYGARAVSSDTVITVRIPAAKGVDIYIIEGENITDVVAQYNMLAGGGCRVPEWGLGTLYRCYAKYNQDEVVGVADYFTENNIPISIIGLEPGWQTHAYSCSFKWNNALYPDPEKLVSELYGKGYHVNLWEHAFTHTSSPIFQKLKRSGKYGSYTVWGGLVPDLTFDEAQDILVKHHQDEVMFGKVDGFKLDECDSSDYKDSAWSFPNCSEFPCGADGEQYHALFGTLYMKTMLKALGDKPTLSEVRSAGALAAPYPFVLYSDLYDHKDFVRGMSTAGFSGLLWTPELRDAKSKEELLRRLQTVVFSPQCLINAWYCEEYPWAKYDCEEEVRELLIERVKLIPKLMAAFERYHTHGIPPVRALVSDYSDDPETYNMSDEYLFCDDMLVAPIFCGQTGRTVYLPKGKWKDYYSDKVYESGRIEVQTEKIPVFVKMK